MLFTILSLTSFDGSEKLTYVLNIYYIISILHYINVTYVNVTYAKVTDTSPLNAIGTLNLC